MTRTTTKPKNVPLAILSIGYRQYVLPSAKAMKVAELLQGAAEVDYDHRASDRRFIVQEEQLRIACELVRADQIRFPEGTTMEPSASALQLGQNVKRLTR